MALLRSYGADRVVTGSCHLLELDNGLKILVDCGMFQGAEEEWNFDDFGFDPSEVDILLLTHAHLDHVGRVPKLVKEGFRGRIYATSATFELAYVVLLDSAHLMEEDYRTRYRKALRRGKEKSVKAPLYSVEDVENVRLLPTEYVKYGKSVGIGKGVRAVFRDAGHILGSSFIELSFKEKGKKKRVVFSGDLGNRHEIVMPKSKKSMKADALLIESTYGDRNHKSLQQSVKEFKKIVRKTLLGGGNVIIPSFAIERTQDILCLLKEMYLDRELPECRVFLDSPMAIRATNIFNRYHDSLSERCREFYERDGDVFGFRGLIFTGSVEDSKRINSYEKGAVIIAGSGMCTGGRILHHFKHQIWNRKNAVIFVGFQAYGTIGRKIVEGADSIKLYHEKVRVKASIHTINGFSAHADQRQLLEWMRAFRDLGDIYIVHGEYDKQKVFKRVIKERMGKKARIVERGKSYYL